MTAVKRQIQYREVAEKIRAEILREKFPHGTPLFSAPQFAKQYKVSLKTANSALNYLAAAGVIFRRQGSGSFVNHPGEEKRSFLIGCTLYDRQQDRDSKVKQILAVAGEQAADLLKREGCHIRSIPTEAWLAPQQGIDCFRRLDGLLLSGAALLEESCRALVEQLEIPVVVFQSGAQWALQVSQVIVNHVPGIREIFRQATRRYTGLTVLYLNHPNGNSRKNAFIREALRAGYRLSEIVVYDYIQVCISGCLISYQQFLSRWTYYLLTREWPDKEAFYKEKWSHEKELREAFQRANAHLARENQEYAEALKERFITVADAARAVLRTVYDHDNVDREADAWRKRIAESGVELGEAVTGRQRRKFYPVPKIIRAFQETNRETVTDIQIADAINARAIPKDKLPL